MRHRKPTGRYGPQKSCACCGSHCGDKVYKQLANLAWCEQKCLDKWIEEIITENEIYKRSIATQYAIQFTLTEQKKELFDDIKDHERTIQAHYTLIDQVHKQLNLAGVPAGGNILDRLKYLVEQFLYYRNYVPRMVLMELDND